MNMIIALSLFALTGGGPVPAGGLHHPCGPAEARHERPAGACDARRLEAAGRTDVYRGRSVQTRTAGAVMNDHGRDGAHARSSGAVRAGAPIRLDSGFFAAPQAGGVERPALSHRYGRGGVIIRAPGSGRAPVSAGEAAAARGLPRG